jgi:hypothetical protein
MMRAMRDLRLALIVSLASLSLTFAGCGGGNKGTASDAGIDAHLGPTMVGDPCTRPADPNCSSTGAPARGSCMAGQVCYADGCSVGGAGTPKGYCTVDCTTTGVCPTGSVCTPLPNGMSAACLKTCQMDSDCRVADGYACLGPNGEQVCFSGGMAIGGTLNGGACVTPPATISYAGFSMPNEPAPEGPTDDIAAEGNVATDGLGHELVSAIGVNSTSSEMVVSSYTDGVGFAPTVQTFGTTYTPGFTSDPVLAFDRSATPPRAYLVYVDVMGSPGGNPTTDKVMMSVSDGAGVMGTWSTPVQVSPPSDSTGGFLDKPWVTARGGNVVVTYAQFVGGGNVHERVLRSSNSGGAFAAPINADMTNGVRNLATPVLDAGGDLFVTYFDETGIVVATEPAGASAFGSAVLVSGPTGATNDDPSIAVSDDGTRLWTVYVNGDLTTGSDIYAVVSKDLGKTFSAPVKVNDDADPKAPQPCATHFHPFVVLDGMNRAHIVWYDNRYYLGNVWYTLSTSDSPPAFVPSAAVNDSEFPFTVSRSAPTWLGDYLGLDTDGKTIYAAWSDPRDRNASHMFFAHKAVEP